MTAILFSGRDSFTHRRKARHWAMSAARALQEKSDCPEMDILVFREAEVERERGCQYSVIHHALKDGREVWRE